MSVLVKTIQPTEIGYLYNKPSMVSFEPIHYGEERPEITFRKISTNEISKEKKKGGCRDKVLFDATLRIQSLIIKIFV